MQTRSKTATKAVPAPKTPIKSKVAAARVKPVPKPGDIVTISGKKETFIGIAFNEDHICIETVSASPDAAKYPDRPAGIHSRFMYPESFVPPRQNPVGSRTGLDNILPSPPSLSSSSLSTLSSLSSIGTEPPSTPNNTYAGSIGPQRTPRAPRKPMVHAQIQDRSTSSISSVSNEEPGEVPNEDISEEKMEILAKNKRTWESGLYQDAAYIHRFDAGMASPNPIAASPRTPKPLGPCGTELLEY